MILVLWADHISLPLLNCLPLHCRQALRLVVIFPVLSVPFHCHGQSQFSLRYDEQICVIQTAD